MNPKYRLPYQALVYVSTTMIAVQNDEFISMILVGDHFNNFVEHFNDFGDHFNDHDNDYND